MTTSLVLPTARKVVFLTFLFLWAFYFVLESPSQPRTAPCFVALSLAVYLHSPSPDDLSSKSFYFFFFVHILAFRPPRATHCLVFCHPPMILVLLRLASSFPVPVCFVFHMYTYKPYLILECLVYLRCHSHQWSFLRQFAWCGPREFSPTKFIPATRSSSSRSERKHDNPTLLTPGVLPPPP